MKLLEKIAKRVNSIYRQAFDIYSQVTEIYNQLSEAKAATKVKNNLDPDYIKKFTNTARQETAVKNRPHDRKRKGKIQNNEVVYNHPRR